MLKFIKSISFDFRKFFVVVAGFIIAALLVSVGIFGLPLDRFEFRGMLVFILIGIILGIVFSTSRK